ncbi:MAG: Omp28-related outer membrane protein [Alistipes sp.]|nr:Omp28-related outer membrane protein [Alistipes sp.]
MKLTKFFAFAVAAIAFVGCGNEPTQTPAPTPDASGNLILKADKTATTVGEVITFTVEDSNGQDLTSVAQIYDPEFNELTDKTFTTTETGEYGFFATYNGETSNHLVVRFMATLPELPEDVEPSNIVFNHRPIVIDHTGVNCGWCPSAMDELRKLESSSWHGKYNEVTCHAGGYAGGDPAASTAATKLATFQSSKITGYPSIVINFNKKAESYALSDIISALNSVYKTNGADVGISMAVTGDDDAIYCSAQIKSAVAQEYYVNAWLLESNIYSPNQAGATKEYHKYYNYALRNFSEEVTTANISGVKIGTIAVGETYEYACAIDMISNSWEANNMGVLVVVSAKSANGGLEVVNSAYCKINETREYEYL